MDSRTDSQAVAASLAEPQLFGLIFDRHFRAIHAFLQRRLGTDLADELASQTFLVAFDKRGGFDLAHESAKPWLFGIAANLARHHQRAAQRRLAAYGRSPVDPGFDALEGIEERADAGRMRGELVAALAALSPEDLETLLLHAWADLSYSEIATTLEVPLGTVRSRLNRARRKIREQVGDEREITNRG